MKKVFSTYALIAGIAIVLCCGCEDPSKRDNSSAPRISDTTSTQAPLIGEGDALCYIDDSCTRETGCLFPDCCEAAAQCHQVGRNSFNRMAGSDEPGKVYRIEDIEREMIGHDCSSWIHLARNPARNSDIVFTVEREGRCPDSTAVHYTIQFFKGVVQRRPEKLVFYKAIEYSRPGIIFSAVRELRQIPGQPAIIYYDYSEANPHIRPEERFRNSGAVSDGQTGGHSGTNPH